MIETFADTDALADAATDATLDALGWGITERGWGTLAATGGRSPAPIYDRLAKAVFDWRHVTVTLSDDRFVPVTSPDSNERLVRERLLVDQADVADFLPLRHDAPDPEASAAIAEPALQALGGFDMLLLGMGEDGHVASLIPGSPVLDAAMDPAGPRWAMGVPAGVGSPPVARVTLTLHALLMARRTLILISGAAKRAIVETGGGLPVHVLLEQAKSPIRVLWTP